MVPFSDELVAEALALMEKISYHNNLFFEENRSEISDSEYELLEEQYKDLLRDNPGLEEYLNQPEVNKGITIYESKSELTKVPHHRPFGSLHRTYDFTSYADYVKLCDGSAYIETKLDGLAIELIYEYGALVALVTKGGIAEGEDVTHMLPLFKHIPPRIMALNDVPRFDVRAEAHLTFDDIEALREKKVKLEKQRNQVSGWIRSLEPLKAAYGYLTLSAYDMSMNAVKVLKIDTGLELRDFLKSVGFTVPDLVSEVDFKAKKRNELAPFDGWIVKATKLSTRERLGERSSAPLWCKAFKFNTLFGETEVVDISWAVYRSSIPPTLVYQEVNIDGSKCTRCSLFDAANVKRLNIGPGDKIRIVMGGDIVPQFDEIISRSDKPRFIPPTECPCCGHPTVIIGVSLTCTNTIGCESKIVNTLVKAVDKPGLDIKGIGRAFVEEHVGNGNLKSVADLYKLTPDQVTPREYQAIQKSRTIALSKFLYTLDIPEVGVTTAFDISHSTLGHPEKIVDVLKDTDAMIKLVGPATAYHIAKYMSDVDNVRYLERYMMCFTIEADWIFASIKQIVITGTFAIPRDKLKQLLMKESIEVVDRVTKNTKCVLEGESDRESSSIKAAKKLKIPVVSLEKDVSLAELLRRIKEHVGD